MRRLAGLTIAAALLAAASFVAALLATAGGSRAAAQETGGCFEPRVLPGLTLAVFAGGDLAHLERCAAAFGSRVHSAAGDGAWLTLDPASSGEANARFRARYAGGVPAGTPFLLERRPVLGLVALDPDASFEGYTQVSAGVDYLIDNRGRIVHEWRMDGGHPQLLEDGSMRVRSGIWLRDIGPNGRVVWQHRYHGEGRLHHDFQRMPNGNLLLLVRRTKTQEEAIAAGANPEFVPPEGLDYEAVVEVRITGPSEPGAPDHLGEIVWEWSLWDHLIQDFDPGKANYGVVADHPELVDLNVSSRASPLPWRKAG